jgi:hydrogenase-4 component H
MSNKFQIASDDKDDVTTRMELFMMTCQRCGRCYEMEKSNSIDRMDLRGFRYDNLEQRALIRKTTDTFSTDALAETEKYARPTRQE